MKIIFFRQLGEYFFNRTFLIQITNGIEVRQEENDGLWKQITDQSVVDPSNVVGQFDHFDYLVKNTSVNIPAILSNVITVEDQVYHSYDK